MLTVFNGLLTPILYMLFFIAAGFLLRRLKALPDNAALVLSKLESNLIIPAMILNTFIRHCSRESIVANYPAMLLSAGLEMLLIILSRPLSGLFAKEGYERNLYRYELIYPNTGFFGYALVQAVFGSEVLYHFMLFLLPVTMGCYTLGISLLTPAGHDAKSQWKRLLNPSMLSVAAGILLGLAGVEKILPQFLSDALSAGASLFTPLAMLLTGFTIGGFALKDLFGQGRSYLVILLRMIVFPALFFFKADRPFERRHNEAEKAFQKRRQFLHLVPKAKVKNSVVQQKALCIRQVPNRFVIAWKQPETVGFCACHQLTPFPRTTLQEKNLSQSQDREKSQQTFPQS